MRPIVIQGAMEVELQYYLEHLSSVTQKNIGNHRFYHGFFQEYPIILAQTQIGMVNCAMSSTCACSQFDPLLLLNQGVAGAHAKDLHVSDIVIGGSAVTINSFEKPFVSSGVNYEQWKHTNFFTPDNALSSDPDLLAIFQKATYEKGQKVCGILGTGDVWNREWDFIHWLHHNLHTSCEDMESFATYQIAKEFEIPVIGLRIISNNERNEEEYQPEVALTLQQFILEQVPQLIAWGKERDTL